MSYCINPSCSAPAKNSSNTNFCVTCGESLLLKDRYRAQKLLGQGGFGKTFRAVDEDRPGQPLCVIKQFAYKSSDPKTQQTALNLFYEEAKHLQSLGTHPQIPELLAYFDVNGQPYLVQQYIDGQDLEQELIASGQFNQQKIYELLESILPVLDFLHNQPKPVIHRDIKPANIIRQRANGALVLVDFGAAKQATQTMLAKTGTMIGSPEFVAPEQLRGKPTFASDIYSLGVTCIYLLTNVPSFDLFDSSQDDWVWRNYLVNNPVDKLLGEVLDGSIVNALARRYQSASDVLIALNGKTKSAAHPLQSIYSSKSTVTNAPHSQPIILETFSFETAQVTKVSRQVAAVRTVTKQGWLGSKKVEENYTKTIDEWQVQKQTSQASRFIEDLGNGIKLEMVAIPSGEFLMGSPDGEGDKSEKPQHKVTVPSFYMGRFPITQEQYLEIMDENWSEWHGENHPVGSVLWDNAKEFCKKINLKTKKMYRLPSEAEWEYACRAGTITRYHFGEIYRSDLAASSFGKTKVGHFPANSFGLCDMHGTVWQWCEDSWHINYYKSPSDGSIWTGSSDCRVLRGIVGRAEFTNEVKGSSASRKSGYTGRGGPIIPCGFRVVCES